MTKDIKKTEIKTTHPLEEFFNLEPQTTEMTKLEKSTELSENEMYDEKDCEIESSFQEVFDKAITAYDNLQNDIADMEPKYIGRLSEVAATTLSVALEAAAKRAKLKEHKDKLEASKKTPKGQTTNNTLIINTSDLIKQLKESEAVDVEFEVAEKKLDNDNE